MSLTGIDAALDRAVQQLSTDQRVPRDAKAAFLELFERFLRERGMAAMTASTATSAGAAQGGAIGTQPLAQLPDDLPAADPQYNAREAELRRRLDVPALERRLQGMAQSYGVEYSVTDLEGILRNAGYDAAHLGSSERYMAAIERFTTEADNNYRLRSSNVPGSNA